MGLDPAESLIWRELSLIDLVIPWKGPLNPLVSQGLSLLDWTWSFPTANSLFSGAFAENNQWQLFNITAAQSGR